MANPPHTYTTRFRSLTPEKLAVIIVHEQDYHADAVQAARLELTARMLPKEELDRIYGLAEEHKETVIDLFPRKNSAKSESDLLPNPTSIWGRTKALKLTSIYFLTIAILHPALIIYQDYIIQNGSVDIVILITAALFTIIYASILWLGRKGIPGIFFMIALFLSFPITDGILDFFRTSKLRPLLEHVENPILSFISSTYFSGVKIVIPGVLLFFLLRKDTRVACGISKSEDTPIDVLDHLNQE